MHFNSMLGEKRWCEKYRNNNNNNNDSNNNNNNNNINDYPTELEP